MAAVNLVIRASEVSTSNERRAPAGLILAVRDPP